MGTKSWLLEEAWNEAMVLHIVDVFLLQSSLASTIAEGEFILMMLSLKFLLSHFDALVLSLSAHKKTCLIHQFRSVQHKIYWYRLFTLFFSFFFCLSSNLSATPLFTYWALCYMEIYISKSQRRILFHVNSIHSPINICLTVVVFENDWELVFV